MNNTKIGLTEAIFIICIITLANLLLSGPQNILKISGSGSILNSIYVIILALAIVFVIYLLFKNFTNSDILDISNYLAGNWLKVLIGIMFILFLFAYSSMNYRDIAENLKIIYFQNVNISYILLLVIVPVAIVNYFGFKTVLKCNLIIVPLILISITIIFIFNIPNFTYQRMFPLLGNGTQNLFITGATNIASFGGILYLYFLMPLLKKKSDFKKVSFVSILICGFCLIITITSLLFILPISITSEESMPIYLATKQLSFGNFIERADILFLLIWILTIFSNLSIAVAFILAIFKKITKINDTKPLVFCFCSILYGISLIYEDLGKLNEAKNLIYRNGFLFGILGINILILILANIKKKLYSKNTSLKGGV